MQGSALSESVRTVPPRVVRAVHYSSNVFVWLNVRERESVGVFSVMERVCVRGKKERETVYISENEREKKRICVGLRKKEKEFWHLCP